MNDIVQNFTRESELRIWPYINSMPNVPHIPSLDYTIIGLVSKPSVYGMGGIKSYHEYVNEFDDVVVLKTFTYSSTGTTLRMEWMKHDGTVGVTKNEFKPQTPVAVANLKKQNRDRTLMYLKATAEGTALETVVDAILKHYKYEIEIWLMNGTSDWVDAIGTEVDATILTYLAIVAEAPSANYPNGITVGEGIIMQTTAGN